MTQALDSQLWDLDYSYTSATHTGNNGQITGITDNTGVEEAGRSVDYTYDPLARLSTAQAELTNGGTRGRAWRGNSATPPKAGD